MTTRPGAPPVACSAFAGFYFPPDVIVLVVRWYLRFALPYRDVEELLADRGIDVTMTHLPLGPAVHAALGRGRPALPACRW